MENFDRSHDLILDFVKIIKRDKEMLFIQYDYTQGMALVAEKAPR